MHGVCFRYCLREGDHRASPLLELLVAIAGPEPSEPPAAVPFIELEFWMASVPTLDRRKPSPGLAPR
jgi:hypothetical protein